MSSTKSIQVQVLDNIILYFKCVLDLPLEVLVLDSTTIGA